MEYVVIRRKKNVIQIVDKVEAVDSWACKKKLEEWYGYTVKTVNILNRIAVIK